jgi:hypothetical protein
MSVHVFEPNLSRIGLPEKVCAGLGQVCALIISRLCQVKRICTFGQVVAYLCIIIIDGQVCLFCLQTDNFRLFLRKQTEQKTNFCLYDEQTVNGIRKIARASVFRFPFEKQHIYRYRNIYIDIYLSCRVNVYICGKWNSRKTATSVCLLQIV